MAQELPGVKIGVTLDSATFVAEMRKLQNSIDGFGRNVTRQTKVVSGAFTTLTTSVKAFGIGLASAIGVGSISQLANLAKGALDAAGNLAELSQQAGVTVEQFQILKLAGVQAGVSQDQLTQSLGRLGRRMAEAGDTRPLVQGLGDVAERIQAASTATEKQAIAFEEFGRAGLKMIPILNQGREGLTDIADVAVRAGLVLGRDLVDEADRASDAIATMQFAFSQGFQVGLVTELTGEIQSTEEAIQRSAEAGRRFGEAFGNAIANIMERIGPFLTALEGIDQFFVKIDKFLKETVGTSLADPTGIVGAIGGALQVNAPDAKIQEIEHLKTVLAELNAEREKFEQLASSVGVAFPESGKLVELNERIKNVKDRLAELTGEQKKATGEQILFGDTVGGTVPTIKEYTDQLKEQEKAQKEAAKQAATLAEALADAGRENEQLVALKAAYEGYGASVEQVTAAIEIDNQLRSRKISLQKAEQSGLLALLRENQKAEQQIQRIIDADAKRVRAQEKAAEDAKRAQERQAEETQRLLSQPFENFLSSVQSSTTSAFEEIYSGGIKSFSDLFGEAKRLAIRFAADLTALAIFNPNAVLGLAGATGAPGATGPISLSQAITGVPAGQPISATGFSSFLPFLGAAGLGGAAGFGIGGAFGGQGGIGGGLGGAGGAALGLALGGPFGALAGGALGSIGGGLLGSLFGGGGGGSGKSGRVGGSLGSTGGPSGFGFVKEMDAAIAGLLNIRQRAAVDRYLGQAAGATFSFKGELGQGTIEHVAGQRGREIAAGLGFRPQGIAPGATAPQQVVANLKSALEARRAIEDLTGSVTAFDRQVEDLQDQFADLKSKGQQFGISTAGLTQAMREQRTELKKAQDAQLSAVLDPFRALSAPLEAFKNELSFVGLSPAEQFQKAQAEFRRIAAEAQTGSVAALEQLQGAGRLFIELAGAAGASPGRDAALREVTATTTAALERIGTAQAEASRGIENVLERTRREQDLNLKNLIATTQDLIKEVKRSRI